MLADAGLWKRYDDFLRPKTADSLKIFAQTKPYDIKSKNEEWLARCLANYKVWPYNIRATIDNYIQKASLTEKQKAGYDKMQEYIFIPNIESVAGFGLDLEVSLLDSRKVSRWDAWHLRGIVSRFGPYDKQKLAGSVVRDAMQYFVYIADTFNGGVSNNGMPKYKCAEFSTKEIAQIVTYSFFHFKSILVDIDFWPDVKKDVNLDVDLDDFLKDFI